MIYIYIYFFFSLFIVLSCFLFFVPVVLPYRGPLCMIPLHYPFVGSKSLSQPLTNWWVRTCARPHKKTQKICDFQFFPSIFIQTLFWSNEIYWIINISFVFFHFSCFYPVSRFVSPLCFPIVVVYDPVALPRRGVEVLEPTVEKTDELGLVSVFKKNQKICDFHFFFDFYKDTIVKQWNILKNEIFFFFHFSLFSLFSVFFSRCASLLWSLVYDPVALPRRGVEVLEPTVDKLMS